MGSIHHCILQVLTKECKYTICKVITALKHKCSCKQTFTCVLYLVGTHTIKTHKQKHMHSIVQSVCVQNFIFPSLSLLFRAKDKVSLCDTVPLRYDSPMWVRAWTVSPCNSLDLVPPLLLLHSRALHPLQPAYWATQMPAHIHHYKHINESEKQREREIAYL